MLVAQEEVEMVRNLLSAQAAPRTDSVNSLLLLLLNIGSSLLFMFDGIFILNGCKFITQKIRKKKV